MQARPVVWVVDDSPLESEIARRSLGAGYDVRLFHEGNDAAEALSSALPDVLIVDWQMPGISGIELCRYLRSNVRTQGLPILMLTVQQDTADAVEGLAAGADDYVRKPYHAAELEARVAALVRSNRLRHRAEAAERTIRSLLMQLPDALVTLDDQGAVTFANAEAERMIVTSAAELVGRRIDTIIPGLHLERMPTQVGEEPAPLADVTVADQIYSPLVRRLPSSETVGTTISFRNVTIKRRAESRRLDFYSIIAHDLRSPLSAISMRAHLMADAPPSTIGEHARKIRVNVKDMVATIDDFLDFARLEATSIRVDPVEVDLAAIVRESVDSIQPLADAKHIVITRREPTEPVKMFLDRRRIGQAVSNLLSNAIKFSPDNSAVDIQIGEVDGAVEVSVTDRGPGIPQDQVAALFQRYVRAVGPGSGTPGTGLGLMIVREIVEAHGGTVHVESELKRGSTFRFRLPHVR